MEYNTNRDEKIKEQKENTEKKIKKEKGLGKETEGKSKRNKKQKEKNRCAHFRKMSKMYYLAHKGFPINT